MRKFFTAIMLMSAPLALAACGEKAAEIEETVVADETVVEEPATDVTVPAEDNAVDAADDTADAAADTGGDSDAVTKSDAVAK